jgi:murein DD-endopeptidase MepM/ murein hydrolase activator NlpD
MIIAKSVRVAVLTFFASISISGITLAATSITVQPGDTLGGIAQRYGTNVNVLLRLNGLKDQNIRVGQTLQIPDSATVTVQPGDNLDAIARRVGTSVEALRRANGLANDNIRAGQTLRISGSSAKTTGSESQTRKTTTSSYSGGSYTVQNGDTLSEIANKLGVKIEALRSANGLSNDNIRIGQVLKIPGSQQTTSRATSKATANATAKTASTTTARVVTVQTGDSLERIAKNNQVSIESLRSANGLDGDRIRVGDRLKIPGVPVAATTKKPAITATKTNSSKTVVAAAKTNAAKATTKAPIAKPNSLSSSKTTTNKTAPAKPQLAKVGPPKTATSSAAKTPAKTAAAKPAPKVEVGAKPAVITKPNIKAAHTQTSKPAKTAVAAVKTAPKVSPVKQPTKPVAKAESTALPITVLPPETTVVEESPPIDPSLESPEFDVITPEGQPTTPSDLITPDELEIPREDSAATVTPAPNNNSNKPIYSTRERVLWPMSGTMTSRFGYRSLRVGRSRFHTGLDLAAPTGTHVYAALSGRVEWAGWNRQGYGYLVIIRGWDNRKYYYGHNSRILVRRGQWVRQGTIISKVGSTGASTGPHLHFEIRVGDRARNPLAYLPRSRLAQARYAK